jgi:AcrR family transcriptional regulator
VEPSRHVKPRRGAGLDLAGIPERASGGRADRRRAENRARLISAAAEVLATDGPEGATVSAITDRADLGAGTFYNYFQSLEQITKAVVADAIEHLGRRLDALTKDMADAADIYSFSLRHLMATAKSDPLWGWLIVRLGIAHEQLIARLGPRAKRDLMIGVESKRFDIPDVDVATALTFGSLLSAIHHELQGHGPENAGEVFAEFMLRMVGLAADEAAEVTRRPLPPLPNDNETRRILDAD